MPGSGKEPEVVEPALRNAHLAFRAIARQRLKRLQAAGVEADAASSQLLDDLVVEPHHRNSIPPAAATDASSLSSSSSSSSPSLQHVVASTGASPAHAAKILQLRDEISRLRREGHSTVSLIERLKERLQEAGEYSANADENGGAWRSSKKRRVADEGPLGEGPPGQRHPGQPVHWDSATPPPPQQSVGLGGAHPSLCLSEPTRLQARTDYAFPPQRWGSMPSSPRSCPADAKRPLDDGFPESVTSLLQLKKLKLRANATSASSPTRDS